MTDDLFPLVGEVVRLRRENDDLKRLAMALANRVADQSEILGRLAGHEHLRVRKGMATQLALAAEKALRDHGGRFGHLIADQLRDCQYSPLVAAVHRVGLIRNGPGMLPDATLGGLDAILDALGDYVYQDKTAATV